MIQAEPLRSYWYKLEWSPSGWYVRPCVRFSGPIPEVVEVGKWYGPYPAKARAMQVGDFLVQHLENTPE